ncbi:HD domain-containing protein [Rhizorhabdus dicambivorans]|uniref:HD domain-containing protein n=1 Tax=Rhizorhabdus dicambivorans TaxID=1850238 RepID=UPI001865644A|nr:HD domain-containing protein [Rhizorhabdus dicambivorans]
MFSPEFQRLRYVRLCNINSLYLTGASEPKRFEHCLGVYHLADVWARERSLTLRETSIVRAAALLHDLLTGPFGHSFQYVMEDNPFEQRFEHTNIAHGVSSRFLKLVRASAHFGGRPFEVASLLGEISADVFEAVEGKGPFGSIISGTLDLDNLDNVVRLAFHMGLCNDEDRALPLKLTPLIETREGRLAVREHAKPLLERWFDIRRRQYELLLLDRGEFSAKAMLTLAVEMAAEANLIGPDDWTLTDDELLEKLRERSVGDNQAIGQIVRRLRVGDLFECVGVWRSDAIDLYNALSDAHSKRELERSIEAQLAGKGAPKVKVCVHYILDARKTCRALSYYDLASGSEKMIGHDSRSLLVGVFLTNARSTVLTAQEQVRVSAIVRDGLATVGLGILKNAEEPLAASPVESGLFV